MEVSLKGGSVPQKWLVDKGKSGSKMDDDWGYQGYPHFRKPPKRKNQMIHTKFRKNLSRTAFETT